MRKDWPYPAEKMLTAEHFDGRNQWVWENKANGYDYLFVWRGGSNQGDWRHNPSPNWGYYIYDRGTYFNLIRDENNFNYDFNKDGIIGDKPKEKYSYVKGYNTEENTNLRVILIQNMEVEILKMAKRFMHLQMIRIALTMKRTRQEILDIT